MCQGSRMMIDASELLQLVTSCTRQHGLQV